MTRVRSPGHGTAMHYGEEYRMREREEQLVRGDVFGRSQSLLCDAIRGQARVADLVQQRAVADAQRPRRLLAVPMAVLQDLQDDFPLQLAYRLARQLLQRNLP